MAKRLSDFEEALRGLHGGDVEIIDVVPVVVREPELPPRPWLKRGFVTMPPPHRFQRWWRQTAPWERTFKLWLWIVLLVVGLAVGFVVAVVLS